MAAEAEGRYTGGSFDSLQAAADDALNKVPRGPEGIRKGKIVELMLQDGGVVGRRQYAVTILAGSRETEGGESGYA
jgi:hypothetical protein